MDRISGEPESRLQRKTDPDHGADGEDDSRGGDDDRSSGGGTGGDSGNEGGAGSEPPLPVDSSAATTASPGSSGPPTESIWSKEEEEIAGIIGSNIVVSVFRGAATKLLLRGEIIRLGIGRALISMLHDPVRFIFLLLFVDLGVFSSTQLLMRHRRRQNEPQRLADWAPLAAAFIPLAGFLVYATVLGGYQAYFREFSVGLDEVGLGQGNVIGEAGAHLASWLAIIGAVGLLSFVIEAELLRIELLWGWMRGKWGWAQTLSNRIADIRRRISRLLRLVHPRVGPREGPWRWLAAASVLGFFILFHLDAIAEAQMDGRCAAVGGQIQSPLLGISTEPVRVTWAKQTLSHRFNKDPFLVLGIGKMVVLYDPSRGETVRVFPNEVTTMSSVVAPTITEFAPTKGRVGTLVTITGAMFARTTIVLFGGVRAVSIAWVSQSELKATVPAGAVTAPITLQTNGELTKSCMNFTVTT